MLDYSISMCLYQKDIQSYHVVGKNFKFSHLSNRIISHKKIELSTDISSANLIIINKETSDLIFNIIKSLNVNENQFIFIVAKNNDEAKVLFKEYRNIGELFFCEFPQPLIIIKSIKENHMQYYRNDLKSSILNLRTIDNFLNIKFDPQNKFYFRCTGSEESQIVQATLTNQFFVYIGEHINEQTLNKCQMLANMNLHWITCYDAISNKIIGEFISKDFIYQILLVKYTKFDGLEISFNLANNHILMPI